MLTIKVYMINPETGERRLVRTVATVRDPLYGAFARSSGYPPCQCPLCTKPKVAR